MCDGSDEKEDICRNAEESEKGKACKMDKVSDISFIIAKKSSKKTENLIHPGLKFTPKLDDR